MTRRFPLLALGLLLAAGAGPGAVRAAGEPIRFSELMDLLRTNLLGATAADLNRAAVDGLLAQLDPQVTVAGAAGAETNAAPAVTSAVVDRNYGYVRLARLGAGADREFAAACQKLAASNTLKGLALDLRFAGGQDFPAALGIADQFFPGEKPLINWGDGVKSSVSKPEAIVLPVVLLVNRQTSGAAEALAGMLRSSDVGLLLGTNTAGRASVTREFTLQTGQRVRVAVAPITVAAGKPMPAGGLVPDIRAEIAPDEERLAYQDAFPALARTGAGGELSLQSTNRPARRRTN
jgi:C-terminal processing protease CtpA/Prc